MRYESIIPGIEAGSVIRIQLEPQWVGRCRSHGKQRACNTYTHTPIQCTLTHSRFDLKEIKKCKFSANEASSFLSGGLQMKLSSCLLAPLIGAGPWLCWHVHLSGLISCLAAFLSSSSCCQIFTLQNPFHPVHVPVCRPFLKHGHALPKEKEETNLFLPLTSLWTVPGD